MLFRVRVLVLGTSAAAAAALAVLGYVAPSITAATLSPIVALGTIAVLAQLLDFAVSSGGSGEARGSVTMVPVLASALLVPAWPTAVTALVVTLGVQLLRGREPAKAVFNASQHTVGVCVAILTLYAAGIERAAAGTGASYLAGAVLFAIFKANNTAFVSAVIALTDRCSYFRVWARHTTASGTFLYDLLAIPLVVALAWLYARFGMIGALGLMIPLLGLRELYKVYSELQKANEELLEVMVAAVEARDPYTSGHSLRVAQNAKAIAQILRRPAREVRRIEIAALLHDVGKIHEVFAAILQKPGRLTDEENTIMQTHAIKSEELVARVTQFKDLLPAVRHHHENWDGTGYPDKIAGEQIPLAARIIMVADTIDAMTSDRPYRKALDAAAVRQELIKWRGRQFDPSICDAVLRSPRYPELFTHSPHKSLPHTQEIPRVRVAVRS